MMTKAEFERHFTDGQQYHSAITGEHMTDVMDAAGARREWRTHTLSAYELADGTVLDCGQSWDFQHDDCTCGCCWDGTDDVPNCQQ